MQMLMHDADADAEADGNVSDCSEGGSDKGTAFKKPKVSREKVSTPQLFDFEVEIISALKDDPASSRLRLLSESESWMIL